MLLMNRFKPYFGKCLMLSQIDTEDIEFLFGFKSEELFKLEIYYLLQFPMYEQLTEIRDLIENGMPC